MGPPRSLKTRRSTLNLCVWNVNGLKTKDFNKLEDATFLNYIKQYDVETHLSDSLSSPLNGYKFHHTFRSKDQRAERSFDGISILIKNSIKDGITVIKPTNSNYCWIKLDRHFFN